MSEPTVILVPGAGGSAWFWHIVQDLLRERGINSVAVDLPGDDPAAGLADYVDLIVDAAAEHDNVLIVGHSLGGFSAAWAAGRVPGARLALVNAMIPVPGETAGSWWGNTGQERAMRAKAVADGRDPAAPVAPETHLLHDVPEMIADAMRGFDREELPVAFETPWGLPAWPDVPTTVLAGEDDRLFPLDFQRRVARERLGLDVVTLPGGHLLALSYPEELTAALCRAGGVER